MINKKLEADIAENQDCSAGGEEGLELANYNCPRCGYPIVIEKGLELCYYCGWSADELEELEEEETGYYDE